MDTFQFILLHLPKLRIKRMKEVAMLDNWIYEKQNQMRKSSMFGCALPKIYQGQEKQ